MVVLDTSIPKYEAICSDLKEKIVRGEFRPGDKLPKERDLAKHYMVSLISIRGALKKLNDERFITTTAGVGSFVAMQEQAVNSSEIKRIAFYTGISVENNVGGGSLIKGVSKAARRYGFRLEIVYPEPESKECLHNDHHLADLIEGGQIDGVIVDALLRPSWDDFYFLERSGVSFVMLGMFKDGMGRSLLQWRKGNWFEQIMIDMIERGYRKIGLVLGPLDEPDDVSFSANQGMISAYKRIMREQLIPIRDQYIIKGRYSVESGYEGAAQLLALDDSPEVILCSDDHIAVGVIKCALESGLNVPKDLKVWGNGDFLYPSMISSVSVDWEKLGHHSVAALSQVMEGDMPEGQPVLHQLVPRESSSEKDESEAVRFWIEQYFR